MVSIDLSQAEGRRVLISDPGRLNSVKVIGVDEQVWRHTRRRDKHATVIIDLTPVRAGPGPARLLNMIQGRSKTWLISVSSVARSRGGRRDAQVHRLQDRRR